MTPRHLPLQTRRAQLRRPPEGEGDATLQVVWSTGAEVRRYDWWADEEFLEVLDIQGADLTRLNAGAPVLNSHRGHGLEQMIGVVERAWLEDGQGLAEIRLSQRPEVAGIRADVASGIIRNVSIGYAIQSLERERRQGAPDVVRVTAFQPLEISLVPIPADHGAQVRRDGLPPEFPVSIREEPPMPPEEPGPESTAPPVTDPPIVDDADRQAPDPHAAVIAAKAAGEQAERQRAADILTLCQRVRHPELAPAFIAQGLSLEAVRQALLNVWAEEAGPVIRSHAVEARGPSQSWEAVLTKFNAGVKP